MYVQTTTRLLIHGFGHEGNLQPRFRRLAEQDVLGQCDAVSRLQQGLEKHLDLLLTTLAHLVMMVFDRYAGLFEQTTGFVAQIVVKVERTAGMIRVLEKFFRMIDMVERRRRTRVEIHLGKNIVFEFGTPMRSIRNPQLREQFFGMTRDPTDVLRESGTCVIGEKDIRETSQRGTGAKQIELHRGKIGLLHHIAVLHLGKAET
jgi:hypothetical protein